MSRLKDFGYDLSLHKEGSNPDTGLGFFSDVISGLTSAIGEEGVLSLADQWNSFTQETCPHKSFLNDQECQLCGNKYVVSRLFNNGAEEVITKKGPENKYVAKVVETFNWSPGNLIGVVLDFEGQRLPGLLVLDRDSIEKSIDRALHEYLFEYYYKFTEEPGKPGKLLSKAWANIDSDEVRKVLQTI